MSRVSFLVAAAVFVSTLVYAQHTHAAAPKTIEAYFISGDILEITFPKPIKNIRNAAEKRRYILTSLWTGDSPKREVLNIAKIVQIDPETIELHLVKKVLSCTGFQYKLKMNGIQLRNARPVRGTMKVPEACFDTF